MIPEKTGAVVWLEEYGCFVRGDSYRLGDYLIVRVNNRSRTSGTPEVIHYRAHRVLHWFDSNASHGTMIVDHFEYLGYDGERP